MKKLHVPYNGHSSCLNMYANWAEYIQDIYFAPSHNVFSSARATETNGDENTIIEWAHAHSIRAALLLNGVADKKSNLFLENLKQYLTPIVEHGLDIIVVSDPFLILWISNHFSNLKIRSSILSHNTSIPSILMSKKLGNCEEVCLPLEFNRNFDELKKLRLACPDIKFSLLVTSTCRLNCPLFYWHQFSHNYPEYWQDYEYSNWCNNLYLAINSLPKAPLQNGFILPSELKEYDEYIDGYKIEGRDFSTGMLESMVRLYSLRTDPIYLNELLNSPCNNFPPGFKLNQIPDKWLKYRKNCKTQCTANCPYFQLCFNGQLIPKQIDESL